LGLFLQTRLLRVGLEILPAVAAFLGDGTAGQAVLEREFPFAVVLVWLFGRDRADKEGRSDQGKAPSREHVVRSFLKKGPRVCCRPPRFRRFV
jgi:hypothetical protein